MSCNHSLTLLVRKEVTIPRRLLFAVALVGYLLASFVSTARSVDRPKLGKGYPFAVAPLQAFAVVADLEKVSGEKLPLAPVEEELFADVAAGKLDKWSFAEMALIASGISDTARRQQFLQQIDKLEAEARQALADQKTDRLRAERLLQFSHSRAMAKGYEGQQTLLSTLLETQRYNCVSSAVLYNVLGRRLGLDLRAVEIPATFLSGHVFSVLRTDGAVIDVETTNKLGFNPQGKRERPDGEGYDPAKDRGNRREVLDLGLVSIIYYNRGVHLSKEKNYHAAIVMNLRALALDPSNASAAKNMLADLNNWGPKLAEQGKYEEGVLVETIGLKLAPDDRGLKNNLKFVWLQYAQAMMKVGKEDEALAVVRRAVKVIPNVNKLPARIFEERGEDLIKEGKWEEALALGQRGLAKLDGETAKELRSWRSDLYLRWAEDRRKKKDWDQVFAVMARATADDPKDTRYMGQVRFLAQECLKETKDLDTLAVQVADLRKRFPDVKGLDDVIAQHVSQEVRKEVKQQKFEEALQMVQSNKDLIANAAETQKLATMVYDQWARARKKDGWKSVIEIYAKGLEEYPGDKLLTHNAFATADAQGVPLMNAKKWDEAIEVFETAMKYLPGNSDLENRLKTCRKRAKK